MAKTRQPVKPLNQSAAQVATAAAAEKARKAASKKALKQATRDANVTAQTKLHEEAKAFSTADLIKAAEFVERQTQDHANALATAKADAEATGVTFEAMCADMGIDPKTGAPATGKPGNAKAVYTGPMLALRDRAKAGAYVKMANGNPSCADKLAVVLGGLNREQVCTVLILAMKLEGNPYRHLNPGQQSMNLRNKARGMIKNGLLQLIDVEAAIERASRHA